MKVVLYNSKTWDPRMPHIKKHSLSIRPPTGIKRNVQDRRQTKKLKNKQTLFPKNVEINHI